VCLMTTGNILVTAASAFIESRNVTHYFTLTYPRRRSWEGRHKAFLEWIDALEWLQRRPLGWFRADEMWRFSGLGYCLPSDGRWKDDLHGCHPTVER
jgi:hypothetical protein